MRNGKFREYMDRLTEEIRNEGSRHDFIGRFVVAWTLLSRIPLPRRLWPSEMPAGNRILPPRPSREDFGLLVAIEVSVVGSLIGSARTIWTGVFFYSVMGWSLHLDGWGTLGRVGSGRQEEELRSAMKDSRLGATGLSASYSHSDSGHLWRELSARQASGCADRSAACGRFACRTAAIGQVSMGERHGQGYGGHLQWIRPLVSFLAFFVFMPIAPVRWSFSPPPPL